jgi:hypothetical protein
MRLIARQEVFEALDHDRQPFEIWLPNSRATALDLSGSLSFSSPSISASQFRKQWQPPLLEPQRLLRETHPGDLGDGLNRA